MQRPFSCVLVALLLAVPALRAAADDVPDDVRSFYDRAQEHFEAGELDDAYSDIARGKLKNPVSVDYWELFVRIWRALGKPEDVLWDKTIQKVEKKHPRSPVFDLLRARLTDDAEERIGHLEAAIAKAPDGVETRLLLARTYVRLGEDQRAEEILDAILEKDPGNETALVTKGDLMIASGYSRSAQDYAEETLARHDLPGLHDLRARALLQVGENDDSVLGEAEAAARKAVDVRATPAYVLTLAEALDRRDKTQDAIALLTRYHEQTKASVLAARLGTLAFRVGDYEAACKGLAPAAGTVPGAAKALACSQARLGRADEARAALAKALRVDPDWHEGAWRVLMAVGDAAAALEHAQAVEAEDLRSVLLGRTWAWQGRTAEVERLCGGLARTGSRAGEDALCLLATAQLLQALGPKAEAARQALLAGRHAAALARTPSATVPAWEPSVAAATWGFMRHYVTYRRSVCGRFFSPSGFQPLYPVVIDDVPHLGSVVQGTCDCERDAERSFPFNAISPQNMGGDVTIQIDPNEEGWQAATQAVAEGAAAFVDGTWAKAAEAFGRAVEVEQAWGRMQAFQGAAVALGGDAAAGADLAQAGIPQLPDDLDARWMAILVASLAGRDVTAAARAVGESQEAFAARRVEDL